MTVNLAPYSQIVKTNAIELRVGKSLIKHVDPQQDGDTFIKELIPVLRGGIYYETGLDVAGITASGNPDMAPQEFRIELHDEILMRGSIPIQGMLISLEENASRQLKTRHRVVHPFDGRHCGWISNHAHKKVAGKVAAWTPQEFLILCLAFVIKCNAHRLFGIQSLRQILKSLHGESKHIADALAFEILTQGIITEVFQRLLEEHVSIRDMDTLLSLLVQHLRHTSKPHELVEHIRKTMHGRLSMTYIHCGKMRSIELDDDITHEIESNIVCGKNGPRIHLNDTLCALLAHLKKQLSTCGVRHLDSKSPIVLTKAPIRRAVFKLLQFADMPATVLSCDELPYAKMTSCIQTVHLPSSQDFPSQWRRRVICI